MEMHSSSVTVEGDGGAQVEPGFRRNSGVARQNLAPPPDTPKVAPQPAGRCMSGSSGPGVGGGMARPAFVEDETDRLSPWLWAGATLLALATLSLALRPAGSVFLIPLSEDGYYAMAIARNIAAGRGITIDGVTATNGFQP